MQVFYMVLFFAVDAALGAFTATSTYEMGRVVEGEDDLLNDFRLYINVVEQKLRDIRIIIDDALKREKEASLNAVAYLSNPLNSFPLLRRMHRDAGSLYSYLKEDDGKDMQQIADYSLDALSDLDLEHATMGLLRIQAIHSLQERDLASGLIGEKQYNVRLNTLDCMALARYLRAKEEDEDAQTWLQLALERYEETPERVLTLMGTERAEILQQLTTIQSQLGDWQGMRETYNQVVEQPEAETFMQLARQQILHVANCRGHSRLPVVSSLRCHYHTPDSPFLRLTPFKQEQLSLDPDVVLFHDVISHEDIAELLRLATPLLRNDRRRIAANARLQTNDSLSVRRVYRRLEDLTGLELHSGKKLKLFNYGLGGQYHLHLDCSYSEKLAKLQGDQIATVLLYLSDVQSGGFTSFPMLQLGVRPTKGSALVWHNTKDGDCDRRMLHTGCPVLQGHRWVAVQWFETAAQKGIVCNI